MTRIESLRDDGRFRATHAPTSRFRGVTISLIVAQPGPTGGHLGTADIGAFAAPDVFAWELAGGGEK